MLVLFGLVVGLVGGDCVVSRNDIVLSDDYEVVELRGNGVQEFSSAIGVFDVDADLVLVADLVKSGISRGYWFQDGCLVHVRILDTGFE